MHPFAVIALGLGAGYWLMKSARGSSPILPVYPPGSVAMRQLFTEAAEYAKLPVEWASAPALDALLAAESGGWVGIPNYQFGDFWNGKNRNEWPAVWEAIRANNWQSRILGPYQGSAESSATGLGQLTVTNIDTGRYYPSGRGGIGNALEEAVGMLRYVKERYGSPEAAWAFHQQKNWY